MKIRVYVGTTEGAVAIERITREPAPNSAMCIGRSTREATASAGYEAFVKQPSGVIEREFGPYAPGAFRLDVSGEIADGDSWQLGVFVAHALAADGRLAEVHDDADAALWLTGEVANDLEVRAVGHVPDKFRAAGDVFAALEADGIPVTVIVPDGNREHLDQAALPATVKRRAVARTGDALAAAGLARPASPDPGTEVIPSDGRGARAGWGRWASAAGIVLIAAAAAAAYPIVRKALEDDAAKPPAPVAKAKIVLRPAAKPAPPKPRPEKSPPEAAKPPDPVPVEKATAVEPPPGPRIRLVIRERRAPPGTTCASVHFRRVAARKIDVPRAAPDRFAPSRHDGLCGLEFTIVNHGAPAYVAAFTTMVSCRFLDAGAMPEGLRGTTPMEGETSWVVDIARRLDGPIAYRLSAVAATTPVAVRADRIRADADPVEAARALDGDGVAVRSARHRVDP